MKRIFSLLVLLGGSALMLLEACATPAAVGPNKPAIEKETLRVAFTSQPDFGDLASLMAYDDLKAQGYTVEPTFFSSADLAVAALERKEADFASGATRSYWGGIRKGVPARVIMEQVANEWTVLAVPGIHQCTDLQDKRYGTNTSGGVARLMTNIYIRDNCAAVKMNEVSIPSSENRAAAMLAGEIDAAGLELADSTRLMTQAPGKFQIFLNFAQALPNLKTTAVHVNQAFAAQHPQAVRDYIRALLNTHRKIKADPTLVETEAVARLKMDSTVAKRLVAAYLTLNAWDVNGGMSEDAVQYSIDFLADGGAFDKGMTVKDVADLSFLNAVLDEIGRQ